MRKIQLLLLVAFCLGFVTLTHGQHQRYAIRNGLGIYGGITQFDIDTENFKTESGQGWMGGMAATVDLPHKWYTVSYNIQLSQNYFSTFSEPNIAADDFSSKEIEYKIFTVQAALVWHIKLIKDNITLDLAPMLQYNSNLELEKSFLEDEIIEGYSNLRAADITDVSRFHINGAAGVTAGFRNFKVRGQYIYGFTNMFGRLDDNDLDTSGGEDDFKGNMKMIALTAMIYF